VSVSLNPDSSAYDHTGMFSVAGHFSRPDHFPYGGLDPIVGGFAHPDSLDAAEAARAPAAFEDPAAPWLDRRVVLTEAAFLRVQDVAERTIEAAREEGKECRWGVPISPEGTVIVGLDHPDGGIALMVDLPCRDADRLARVLVRPAEMRLA
jgi:hypothetical protein